MEVATMGGGKKSLFCPVGVAALSKPFIRSERGGRGGRGHFDTPRLPSAQASVAPSLPPAPWCHQHNYFQSCLFQHSSGIQ